MAIISTPNSVVDLHSIWFLALFCSESTTITYLKLMNELSVKP